MDTDDEVELIRPEIIPNSEFFEKYLARCYNDILNSEEINLNQTGDFMGCEDFRTALASFLFRFHKLEVEPERIVVGSSVETLMFNLLHLPSLKRPSGIRRNGGLLSHAEKLRTSVLPLAALPENARNAAKRLFSDAGFDIKLVAVDEIGVTYDSLLTSGATVLYVEPEFVPEFAVEDPAERRADIFGWANDADYRYIIEYDNTRTVHIDSTFKGEDSNDKVIYINSFSTLLCKGISASWMVLPKQIYDEYRGIAKNFPNSLSYLDQLALAQFLDKGFMDNYLQSIESGLEL